MLSELHHIGTSWLPGNSHWRDQRAVPLGPQEGITLCLVRFKELKGERRWDTSPQEITVT